MGAKSLSVSASVKNIPVQQHSNLFGFLSDSVPKEWLSDRLFIYFWDIIEDQGLSMQFPKSAFHSAAGFPFGSYCRDGAPDFCRF
jgi:hypothetical protein